MSRIWTTLCAFAAVVAFAPAARAQPLGTFQWQLQPYCNVLTVNLTQQGAVYTVDGFDDQCGAPQRALLVGLATPNPDGTIGMGLNIVTAPGGRAVQVDARITLPSGSGSWTDSAGNAGTFAFGAASAGSPRPLPQGIPSTIQLLTDGGLVARGLINSGTIPATGAGARMMWYPGKAAFRAGVVSGTVWDDASVGRQSVAFNTNSTASGSSSAAFGDTTTASARASTAMGMSTTASGLASTAIGDATTASADRATAMGYKTTASGSFSTAMGAETTASGVASAAMGYSTIASGDVSTAMGLGSVASGVASLAVGSGPAASGYGAVALGDQTSAAGDSSVALGYRAVAIPAADGSFVFADRSSTNNFASFAPNEFVVRAAGGVGFYTNAPTTTGVQLAKNGSSWAALSDANAKENFRDVAGEDVLAKLAAMSIQEWNYKAQDASIRHMGPTAQEFRAAFGLGDFPLRINTVDADGVALAAVKALEARTRATNERLTHENDELRARLARLEAMLQRN